MLLCPDINPSKMFSKSARIFIPTEYRSMFGIWVGENIGIREFFIVDKKDFGESFGFKI